MSQRKANKRRPIPSAVEGQVLIRSRRRCCLCLFWNGDITKKEGQIAHIDHDPANNGADNLVFLCFEHHNEYDRRNSQGKNVTEKELRHAQSKLDETMVTGQKPNWVVTLTFDHDFDSFTDTKQEKLLSLIQQVVQRQGSIEVKQKTSGSVVLTFEFNQNETEKLFGAIAAGKFDRFKLSAASLEEAAKTSADTTLPAPERLQTGQKTVVELDLVGYSTIGHNLEQGLDVNTVFQLNQQIQSFIEMGLKAVSAPRDRTVMATTGDGAILVFDSAQDAHRFAEAVHAATREHNRTRKSPLAKRVFRSGAATGEIAMQAKPSGGFEIAGTTIARAVRLEAKATSGALLIDEATFKSLSAEQKTRYGTKARVPGKRDEEFEAYACQLNADGSRDAAFFTEQTRKETPPGIAKEFGRDQRREVLAQFKQIRPRQYAELIFLLELPIGQRPPDTLNLDDKKSRVLQWAEENDRLGALSEIVRELTGPSLAGCEIDAEVAARLVTEAGKPGGKAAIVDILVAELPTRPDPTERYWIYTALGKIGGKTAANAVSKGLTDPNAFARRGAEEAMAAIRPNTPF